MKRGDYRRAFWWTLVPIGGLALLSAAGWSFSSEGVLAPLWGAAAVLAIIAIFVAIGFELAGRRDVAAGMIAAISVSVLILTVTCFANVYMGLRNI